LNKQLHERSVGGRSSMILWAKCRQEHEL
jgi:hypothetical protein